MPHRRITRLVGLVLGSVVHKGPPVDDAQSNPFFLDPQAFRAAFGQILRERRDELALTQNAVAVDLDVRPSRIWEWEKGMYLLRWDRLLLICLPLAITPSELIARVETRTRDIMRGVHAPDAESSKAPD